jgi:hypothetical protein
VRKRLLKQHPEHEAACIDSVLHAIERTSKKVSGRVSLLSDRATVENLKETRVLEGMVADAGTKLLELHQGIDDINSGHLEMERRRITRDEQHIQHIRGLLDTVVRQLDQRYEESTDQVRYELSGLQAAIQGLVGHAALPPSISPNSNMRGE